MRERRGLSTVVATLIIILLTLVAIGIVWVVIRSIISSGTSQIEVQASSVDLQIKSVLVTGENATVSVKRNSGNGNFTAMDFVFSNGTSSETVRENISLTELETQSFTFTLSTTNISKVSVVPVLTTSSGQQAFGRESVFNIQNNGGTQNNSNENNSNQSLPDTTPAFISNGQPTGTLLAGTTSTILNVTTDEVAICRYSTTPGIAYASMPSSFITYDGISHYSGTIFGLQNGVTYNYYVRCNETFGNVNTADYGISFSVANQADTTPPVLSNGIPSGTLSAGITSTMINVTTNEAATCKYSTSPGTAYASMTNTFIGTGTTHGGLVSGLQNGMAYNYYIRCNDTSGNINTADYGISFSIASPGDTTPPTATIILPTSNQVFAAGTTSTILTVLTNEAATCRWSTSNQAYGSMTNTFTTTGGTGHNATLTGLSNGNNYTRYVRCNDTSGNVMTSSVSVSFSVANQADTTPPVLNNGQPTGTLAAGTTNATLGVTTNEAATCRYSTSPGTAYSSMTNTFTTTGGTTHTTTLTGLSNGNNYTRYVRCNDTSGNVNTVDYTISFSVASPGDTTPPVLSNGIPSGTLSAGITSTMINVTTNEAATCRYSTSPGTAYASMTNTFIGTGTVHGGLVSGLQNGTSYNYYTRCNDTSGNINTADYTISFSVASSGGGNPNYRANEPAGLTFINERQFNAKLENSWYLEYPPDNYFTIVTDATAPVSPSNVGQALYPTGFSPGAGPIDTEINIGGYTQIYMSFPMKLSSNFYGCGTNKIFFIWIAGQPGIYLKVDGNGAGALTFEISTQSSGSSADPLAIGNVVNRNQWANIEVYMKTNTGGNSDGIVKIWQDGNLVINRNNVRFVLSGDNHDWQMVSWNPTWGGGCSGSVPSNQYMWMDNVYISEGP